MHRALLGLIVMAGLAPAGEWIRPAGPGQPLIWGRTDGVVFGLPSEGGMRGPRGLIRIGIPYPSPKDAELINFVAVEPVTEGPGSRHSRMGFSELEPSQLDAPRRGKRLWVYVPEGGDPAETVKGELRTLAAKPPIEELTVRIEVEPFTANGAHVYVVARMYSDRPQEVAFSVYQHEDSKPVEELTLTATMGNFERLRYLWLKDRIVRSKEIYADYTGTAFVDLENYPIEEMLRVGDGDALVLASNDDPDPAAVQAPWQYRAPKLTQYWRVPARHIQPDLRVKVNGRRVYWAILKEIPGGPSFENVEVRQRYVPGQVFIFGLVPKEPWEIRPAIPRLAKPPA